MLFSCRFCGDLQKKLLPRGGKGIAGLRGSYRRRNGTTQGTETGAERDVRRGMASRLVKAVPSLAAYTSRSTNRRLRDDS